MKKTNGDAFVAELKEHQVEYVDNRTKSNIVWVICDEDKEALIEKTISKYSLKSTLEKRGADATKKRPAWRVMIEEEKKWLFKKIKKN